MKPLAQGTQLFGPFWMNFQSFEGPLNRVAEENEFQRDGFPQESRVATLLLGTDCLFCGCSPHSLGSLSLLVYFPQAFLGKTYLLKLGKGAKKRKKTNKY